MSAESPHHHAGGYADFPFVQYVYDHLPAAKHRRDVDFHVEIAKQIGGEVLELAAGSGRIAIPTARAGVPITALDLSTYMLAALQESLAREPKEVSERVRIAEADMRQFDLGVRYQLITIPFYSFQHLTETDDQLACLRSCHRHLADDGRLVINVTNPSLPRIVSGKSFDEIQPEPEFKLPDGRSVIRKIRDSKKDLVNQVITSEFIYLVTNLDGTQERLVHELPMRYIFRNEMEHLLARAGFAVEAIYEDFQKTPFGTRHSINEAGWSAGEMIVVAKKCAATA
uniref:class I SAM-dependent methyltransferase n=1 Tax=Cephaloticoccus sp. TaxID=1985742 RepID=UPI00404AD029